jgi:hypothetical protein
MDRFDQHLSECLESLSSGRRTLEQCLAAYPEEAERLEPLLRTALLVGGALSQKPRPEFVAAARERFLRVTTQKLREALAVEPRPSFVAAARRRFLEAAQQMASVGRGRAWPFPRALRPSFPARALVASACALSLLFVGFGSFAVVTSGDTVPGDWRYPVKRATEDVRQRLAFSEDARRSLKVEFTEERLYEIETLAGEGRPIGSGLLSDLKGNTSSLAKSLDTTRWNADDALEVADLTKRQQQVLDDVEPLVKPEAQQELAEAKAASKEAHVKAAQAYAIALMEERNGRTVVSAPTKAAATSEATEAPPGVLASPEDEEPFQTPAPGETVAGPSPEPTSPPQPAVTPIPGRVMRLAVPGDQSGGLTWDRIIIDRFSVEVPSEASGWHLMGLDFGADDETEAPVLLRVINADGTAIIVLNPRNGDTYWYQYVDGYFEQFIVRLATGSTAWQADEEAITSFYPSNAAIILHVIESIDIQPPPTPTPVPTETPLPPETPTVAANGLPSGSPTPAP